jgi:hypothetical protein
MKIVYLRKRLRDTSVKPPDELKARKRQKVVCRWFGLDLFSESFTSLYAYTEIVFTAFSYSHYRVFGYT